MEQTISRTEFDRLDKQVNGNGQPGIKQELAAINSKLDKIEGVQEERERAQIERHEENSLKTNWIIAIATACLVIVTVVGAFVTLEVSNHSQLDPAQIFHSLAPIPVLSLSQHAGALGPHHF